MGIIPNWQTFRYHAAVKVETAGTYTFVASSPPTITQAAGDFTADGFLSDMKLDAYYTVSNNHRFTIDTVAALTLTLDATDDIVAEGPIASSLLGVFRDPDGLEQFPSELGNTNLVRAAGFNGGLGGFPGSFGGNMSLSINSFAADAVDGQDEYHWYLSQRTDVVANQYLVLSPYFLSAIAGVPVVSRSGSIKLTHTALALSELGFTGPTDISTRMIRELFKHCALYVKRLSDGAIQWFDLYRLVVNP